MEYYSENMKNRFVTERQVLEKYLKLTSDESDFFEVKGESLPLRATVDWLERIEGVNDPLRLQVVPRKAEYSTAPGELEDPIGDRRHSPFEGLIHHYHDRALILITDKCAMYCRHCFRRHFTGTGGALSREKIDRIMDYIRDHEEIHEILISGGDSLMAPLDILSYLLERLDGMGRPLVKRIATRLPVASPGLLDDRILDLLGKHDHIWMVLQVNHIKEMNRAFDKAVRDVRMRGIPLLNQAVLLKGINDTVDDQRVLCYGLVERGIKPYYLFQGDMAKGTGHFRVPIDRALRLYGELSRTLSHLALPRFGLDLPGGGGKVNLEESSFAGRDERYYYFINEQGETGRYPREKE